MMKACIKCGRIHPYNYTCDKYKAKRIYTGGEERKDRSSYAWTKKSKEIRERANGLCEVCRDMGIYNYKGLEVHHIVKLRDEPQGLLDNNNLICLCVMHHKQADDGQLSASYLKTLAEHREK